MKKVKKVLGLLSMAVILSITLFPSTSSAQWGNWTNTGLGGDCRVRVWTDANTYTAGATTIDYMAEQQGNCGRLYYRASVNLYNQRPIYHVRISPYQSGYFNNSTPIKQINLSSLTQTGVSADVKVDLYTDSARTRYIGYAHKRITVHQR